MSSSLRREARTFSSGGGPNSRKNSNIAITVLALETEEPAERLDWARDEDMPELKLINEFQTRRKYAGFKKTPKEMARDKTILELGLSGTRYHIAGVKRGLHQPEKDVNTEDTLPSKEGFIPSKAALPPISPMSPRSESTTPFQAASSSLLSSDFGFKKQSSDTFPGLYNLERRFVPHDLEREFASQARRHIYACHNLGSVRKGSRAAQSVLGLKQTMSAGLTSDHKSLKDVNRSKNLTRLKQPLRTYPSLSHIFTKPSVNPELGLPIVSGSGLLNTESDNDFGDSN